MVIIILHCPRCGSEALVRDGHAPNGKQKDRCHACSRRSRENPTPNVYPEVRREEILHASQERSSLRVLTRTFGVSRATVASWIKKKERNFLPYPRDAQRVSSKRAVQQEKRTLMRGKHILLSRSEVPLGMISRQCIEVQTSPLERPSVPPWFAEVAILSQHLVYDFPSSTRQAE